jgi:hypothetical protein
MLLLNFRTIFAPKAPKPKELKWLAERSEVPFMIFGRGNSCPSLKQSDRQISLISESSPIIFMADIPSWNNRRYNFNLTNEQINRHPQASSSGSHSTIRIAHNTSLPRVSGSCPFISPFN